MSSIQRFLKQRNLATSIIQAPDNDCYYIFVAAPGNYVGNYPPGYMQLATVNPALIPQGTLLRDMGKTIKAPIGTNPAATAGFFQEVQFIAPQPASSSNTFGVGQGSQGAGTLPSAGNAGDAGYGTYYLATVIDGTLATSNGTTTAVLPIVSTVPAAPTITRIEPGDGQTTVHFTPSSDPSSNIIGHRVSVDNGPFMPIETPTLFGMTLNSTTETNMFTHNGINGNTHSLQFASVGPKLFGLITQVVVTHGVPSAPTNIIVTPGNGQLTVAFTPPSYGDVSSYQYSMDRDANGNYIWISAGVTSSPFVITGLTNGGSYYFQIRANGTHGAGISAYAAGFPGVPTAPTITGVTPGGVGQLTVNFTAPSTDGGFPISSYQCIVYPKTGPFFVQSGPLINQPVTNSSIVITGLTNGLPYSIFVQAINSNSTNINGINSNMVSGTPGIPTAPTITGIRVGNEDAMAVETLTVDFTAPSTNGGFPITGYRYSTNNGISFTFTPSTSSPIVIRGLTNGTTCDVIIQAVNRNSTNINGINSNMVSGTPLSAAIINIRVKPIGRVLKVTFNQIHDSNPDGSYEYQVAGGDWIPVPDLIGGIVPVFIDEVATFFIGGLTVNTSYPIIIQKYKGASSAPVSGTPVYGTLVQESPAIIAIDSSAFIGGVRIFVNPFNSFVPFSGDLFFNNGARVIGASGLIITPGSSMMISFTNFANIGDSFTNCYIQLYDTSGYESSNSTPFYFTLGGTNGMGSPP